MKDVLFGIHLLPETDEVRLSIGDASTAFGADECASILADCLVRILNRKYQPYQGAA